MLIYKKLEQPLPSVSERIDTPKEKYEVYKKHFDAAAKAVETAVKMHEKQLTVKAEARLKRRGAAVDGNSIEEEIGKLNRGVSTRVDGRIVTIDYDYTGPMKASTLSWMPKTATVQGGKYKYEFNFNNGVIASVRFGSARDNSAELTLIEELKFVRQPVDGVSDHDRLDASYINYMDPSRNYEGGAMFYDVNLTKAEADVALHVPKRLGRFMYQGAISGWEEDQQTYIDKLEE